MTIFKHVLSGPQAAGDFWSTGFHTQGGNVAVEAAHAALAGNLAGALGGTGLAQWLAAATVIRDITTYLLDPATGKATSVVRSGVNIPGTSSGAQPSPRDAVVVGLRTAVPGPRGRGRMYLPAPALSNFDANGLLNITSRQGIANSIGALMAAMAADSYIPGLFHVGNAAVDAFNGVTVGAVAGTQRRRSNKIAQSYASSGIV